MKKKQLFLMLFILWILLTVLFVPIQKGPYEDGGTQETVALTYKIVDWNRLNSDGAYTATKVYWFPNNFKSIDQLWDEESQYARSYFTATILELDSTSALVRPDEGELEAMSADKIYLSTSALEDIGAQVGSNVGIWYIGGIMESYPAQIRAVEWELLPPEQDALSRDP